MVRLGLELRDSTEGTARNTEEVVEAETARACHGGRGGGSAGDGRLAAAARTAAAAVGSTGPCNRER